MHSKGLAFACINRSFRALDCQMYASHGQDTQKIPRLVNMNSDPSLEVPEDSHIGMHLLHVGMSAHRAAWFTICHWVKRPLLRCSSRWPFGMIPIMPFASLKMMVTTSIYKSITL